MANSGFNQSQTGNATEVGAGVVKLATQAQIDAKQADDGGVPLVVTPDKIPQGSVSLVAGEDILTGQPVIVGDGLDSSVLLQTDVTGTSEPTNTIWLAQSFVVPVGLTITTVAMMYSAIQSGACTYRLRETIDGPDLGSGTVSFGFSGGGNQFRTAGFAPVTIIPGDTYWIVASFTRSFNVVGSPTNDYPDGEALISNDGGVTWVAPTNVSDLNLYIVGTRTAPGLAYLANIADKNSHIGFASADALITENVNINTSNFLDGLMSGLSPGSKYYYSSTRGELATSGSILLGVATDANSLVRKTNNN